MSRKPILKHKESILRVTVQLDLLDTIEVAFARAFLMRMNVLHAVSKPDAMQEILQGDQVSTHWHTAQNKKAQSGYMLGNDSRLRKDAGAPPSEPTVPAVIANPAVEPAKAIQPVVVIHKPPVKILLRIKEIVERKMPRPKLLDMDE